MSVPRFSPAWQSPLQWPQPAGHAQSALRDARRTERTLKAAFVFALLALTILDRFGLRLTADYSIPPGLVAMYVVLAAMMVSGVAELNARGALAYLTVASIASLSYMVNTSLGAQANVSLTSLFLLCVLYAPFAISLRRGAVSADLWRWVVQMYVAFALFVAIAGIAQFFAQFAFSEEWLFDYTALIPEALRRSGGWNTVNAAGEWIKSNGFFLREASIFSIVTAFALVCELNLSRRKWVMAILAFGLLLTYSGSGLVCLALALLFPLGSRSVLRLLAFLLAGVAIFYLFGEALNLSYTLNRVEEFGSQKTSAYCRFIYPGALVLQHLDANAWTSVLGNGPGTMPKMDAACADGVETTYGKALFEYGVLGALAFGLLIVSALNRSGAPIQVRVALAVMWLLLGGNLLTSEFLLLILLFCAIWSEARATPAPLQSKARRP
jgi:hypothetical protein